MSWICSAVSVMLVGVRRALVVLLLLSVSLLQSGGFCAAPVSDSVGEGLAGFRFGQLHVPAHLEFAGERVPLELFDVRESLERELAVAANWHSQMSLILRRAGRYFPQIERVLREEGVPEDFKYLAVAESSLMDRAVSPSGAVGIWQFLEATGREFGLEINAEVDERYHLERATRAACRYLRRSLGQLGSWTMAAGGYNMGVSGIKRIAESQGQQSYYDLDLNQETARYVYRILALREVMVNPSRYGFSVRDTARYSPLRGRVVRVDYAVPDLARFAVEQGTNYKVLRLVNPWLRGNRLTGTPERPYELLVVGAEGRQVLGASE